MDYTKLTLGQLLGSEDITISRNAMSILKTCQKCDHKFEHSSCIYCLKPSKGTRPADSKHSHDFDNFGKCCICGKWKHQLKTCDLCGGYDCPGDDFCLDVPH